MSKHDGQKEAILASLLEEYERVRQAVCVEEKRAVALLEEYWTMKGEFAVGDIAEHPTLTPRNGFLWVVQMIEYRWNGEIIFQVQQETESGVLSGGYRRVTRDGLLVIRRRNA